MEKKDAQQLTNDVLMADVLIRLKAIENLLLVKKVFTDLELHAEVRNIAEILSMTILQKANVSGDINKFIEDLK